MMGKGMGKGGMDHMMGKGQEHMMGKGQEHMMGKGQEHMMGKGQEHMMGKGQEHMMGKGQEHMMGKGQEHMMGKGMGKGGMDHMMGKGQEHMMGKGQEHMMGKGQEHMMGQRGGPLWFGPGKGGVGMPLPMQTQQEMMMIRQREMLLMMGKGKGKGGFGMGGKGMVVMGKGGVNIQGAVNMLPVGHNGAKGGGGGGWGDGKGKGGRGAGGQKVRADGRGEAKGGAAEGGAAEPGSNSTTLVCSWLKMRTSNQNPPPNTGQLSVHFSQFGSVLNVQMRPQQKAALVQYASHEEASACFDSPASVCNNRFITLDWAQESTASSDQTPARGAASTTKADNGNTNSGVGGRQERLAQERLSQERLSQERPVVYTFGMGAGGGKYEGKYESAPSEPSPSAAQLRQQKAELLQKQAALQEQKCNMMGKQLAQMKELLEKMNKVGGQIG
jgi:hypothetical protein